MGRYSFTQSRLDKWTVAAKYIDRAAKFANHLNPATWPPAGYYVAELPLAKTTAVTLEGPAFTKEVPLLDADGVPIVNRGLEDLSGNISRYSPLNGVIQQWWVVAYDPASGTNPLAANSSLSPPVSPHIWMLANSECLEPWPVVQELLINNVGILSQGATSSFPAGWTAVDDFVVYSMPPLGHDIGRGIMYNTMDNLARSKFFAVFQSQRAGFTEPIKLDVYLRHQVFIHND